MIHSKTLARLLTAVGAAILAVALFVPAMAQAEAKEGYKQFSGCPTKAQSASTVFCVRTDVTGGHLQIGKKDVTIKKTITLTGGIDEELGNFTAGPEGGLLPAQQEVPGGVIGITGLDWLVNFLNAEALKLYVNAELAGQVGTLAVEPVVLPIKAHLINPVLGNNCYIGSNSKPITLNLITGTTEPPSPNKPIKGKEPKITADGLEIIHEDEGTFVDNSFSAPGASGCVLTLLGFIPINLDGLVNFQAGVPAAAGTNETKQNFNIELVNREHVY